METSSEQEAVNFNGLQTLSSHPQTELTPVQQKYKSRAGVNQRPHMSDKVTGFSLHLKHFLPHKDSLYPCSPWIKHHMLPSQWLYVHRIILENSEIVLQCRIEQPASVSAEEPSSQIMDINNVPTTALSRSDNQPFNSFDCRGREIWIPVTEKHSPFIQLPHLEHRFLLNHITMATHHFSGSFGSF